MANRVNVKVAVPDLIKKVEQFIASEEAKYKKALEKYEKDVELWPDLILARLEKAVERFRSGKHDIVNANYYGENGTLTFAMTKKDRRPHKPSKPNLASAKKDLELLKIAVDENILVTHASNWAKYF